MKWTVAMFGGHRVHSCGKFQIVQMESKCLVTYGTQITLIYDNIDMAKRVAGYLHQGGLPL